MTMANYNPPPNRLFSNARDLVDELERALSDAQSRRNDAQEVEEARETRDELRSAKSSIESVLDGNKSLMQNAGYEDLVNQAEDLVSRLEGKIQQATNFIENNAGSFSGLSGHSTVGVRGSS